MNEWIEAINLVAATYSAPPLPAPVGSWYNNVTYTFCDQTFNQLILDCLTIANLKKVSHRHIVYRNFKGSAIRDFESGIMS